MSALKKAPKTTLETFFILLVKDKRWQMLLVFRLLFAFTFTSKSLFNFTINSFRDSWFARTFVSRLIGTCHCL